MDRTHLRWFTPAHLASTLFETAGAVTVFVKELAPVRASRSCLLALSDPFGTSSGTRSTSGAGGPG